jgi:glycosyltransferase involved in cell wall biosynthesis
MHFPAAIKKSHLVFYKKYTGRFIRKAKKIITVSAFSAKDINKHYPAAKEKMNIVYNGVRTIFSPTGEDKKTAVKNKFTEGKEFFLYAGSVHPRKNLVNLLKAYSIFKKRLQSGLKLVICGRLAWKNETFLEDLASYKYRDDVIMTGYLPDKELTELMGAAYAFVYPSLYEGFGMPVLEAMRAGIPVITSTHSAMEEICGDAALYADPASPASIAEKMMLIYKDEGLKNKLVDKGRSRQAQFSWDKTADQIWEILQ